MDESIPKGEQAAPVKTGKKRRWPGILFWCLLLAFVLIQFFQPDKNNNNMRGANHISSLAPVPDTVEKILKVACYDCHSNYTHYPWYTNIQPVGWWLADHIEEGKKHFNFDEFVTYNTKRRLKKLKEVKETIADGSMPLNSYTWIHKDALLTAAQKQIIISWTDSITKTISLLPIKE